MPPSVLLRRASVPAAAAPTWAEIAALLDLPCEPALDLTVAQAFDGPDGLRCALLPEPDGDRAASVALRPVVSLGLRADALPGGSAGALLAMQAWLLASGRWFLGMAEDGELQLSALVTARTAAEVATCFCEGHLAAWVTLRALLQPDGAVVAAAEANA